MADVENAAPAEPVQKLVAQWIREKKPEGWKLAGALFAQKWDPEFSVVSESDFDAAVQAVGEIRIG